MNGILENINDGIITTGADGLVNYINQYASSLIGIDAKDALGKSLDETVRIVDVKSGKPVKIPFQLVLKNNERLLNRNHSVLISAGNKETHVSYDISPIKNGTGKKPGILFVIRDNTNLLKTQAEAELKFNSAQEELDQFIYIASHDLQEPLRMVSSYVQLLEKRYKGKLDSDADEFISYAVNGVSKMKNILTDLLAYSRLNTRREEFSLTDCNTLMEGIAGNFKARGESDIEFTYSNLPVIKCDENQVYQLFYQLIDNAIKFNKSAKRVIKISGERKEHEWLFRIEDNGIGIDGKYSDKIFEMFQRLHGAEYQGTGIGLALCRKITGNHDGKIWLEPGSAKGSVICFTVSCITDGNA